MPSLKQLDPVDCCKWLACNGAAHDRWKVAIVFTYKTCTMDGHFSKMADSHEERQPCHKISRNMLYTWCRTLATVKISYLATAESQSLQGLMLCSRVHAMLKNARHLAVLQRLSAHKQAWEHKHREEQQSGLGLCSTSGCPTAPGSGHCQSWQQLRAALLP